MRRSTPLESNTASIDVRAFTLANPYRVVMDMPQVTFRLPPKTGEAGRGLALVAALSHAWGVLGDQYSRAVWAEILFPVEDDAASTSSQTEEA